MSLPGTYAFGAVSVFVAIREFLGKGQRWRWLRRLFLGKTLVSISAALFITLSRFAAVSVAVGLAVAMGLRALQQHSPRALLRLALVSGLGVTMAALFAVRFPAATAEWNERFETAKGSSSWITRQENNETYLKVLQRLAIIGHPGFEQDDAAVGGYNDTIAPLALWWYYGLVAALAYCFVMLAVAERLLRADPHGLTSPA